MSDQADIRKGIAGVLRSIGNTLLPQKGERVEDAKGLFGAAIKSVLGSAAHGLAGVVEIVQCAHVDLIAMTQDDGRKTTLRRGCFEDATMRRPRGGGEDGFDYRCKAHAPEGEGWEPMPDSPENHGTT